MKKTIGFNSYFNSNLNFSYLKNSVTIFTVLFSLTAFTAFADEPPTGSQDSEPQAVIDPIYTQVFKEVDRTNVITHLKEMTGYLPVQIDGQVVNISERYTSAGKANFRKYWKAYFNSIGVDVTEQTYLTAHDEIEATGHNLEAVIQGKSADSVVIIVHYDSMGPQGHETANPGVDDDMTGMSTQLETARILMQHKNELQYTVRFVAADFEEWGSPGLEGARNYAKYIKNLATTKNFKLVSAIDDEQSGWNCAREGKCKDGAKTTKFLINDCSKDGRYASKDLSKALQTVAHQVSTLPVVTECAGQDSDHYAMWEIGMPAIEFGEFSWQTNDHFDDSGNDTYEKIDEDYYFSISQIGITFAATQAKLVP